MRLRHRLRVGLKVMPLLVSCVRQRQRRQGNAQARCFGRQAEATEIAKASRGSGCRELPRAKAQVALSLLG